MTAVNESARAVTPITANTPNALIATVCDPSAEGYISSIDVNLADAILSTNIGLGSRASTLSAASEIIQVPKTDYATIMNVTSTTSDAASWAQNPNTRHSADTNMASTNAESTNLNTRHAADVDVILATGSVADSVPIASMERPTNAYAVCTPAHSTPISNMEHATNIDAASTITDLAPAPDGHAANTYTVSTTGEIPNSGRRMAFTLMISPDSSPQHGAVDSTFSTATNVVSQGGRRAPGSTIATVFASQGVRFEPSSPAQGGLFLTPSSAQGSRVASSSSTRGNRIASFSSTKSGPVVSSCAQGDVNASRVVTGRRSASARVNSMGSPMPRDSDSSSGARLNVGPTIRMSRNAHQVIMGSRPVFPPRSDSLANVSAGSRPQSSVLDRLSRPTAASNARSESRLLTRSESRVRTIRQRFSSMLPRRQSSTANDTLEEEQMVETPLFRPPTPQPVSTATKVSDDLDNLLEASRDHYLNVLRAAQRMEDAEARAGAKEVIALFGQALIATSSAREAVVRLDRAVTTLAACVAALGGDAAGAVQGLNS